MINDIIRYFSKEDYIFQNSTNLISSTNFKPLTPEELISVKHFNNIPIGGIVKLLHKSNPEIFL